MVQAPTRIIDDGRVTIPVDVRRKLDLQKGDYVLVEIEPLQGVDDGSR